ncbi:MAG TPA: energy-converting hydrogenase subunit EhaL family protein [Methanobacteriaceae archaeon]|nr:energy-converting hydrogenase subunit EhaL family protein [Methanobacteriaceae archaeon]
MNETIYLLYILAFVLGSVMGLVLSYKKYTAPYALGKIDILALILAIIGWTLALNSTLITFIPYYLTITIGVFLFSLVLGMRPGYGRNETFIGIIIAGIIWILRMVLL